MADELDKELLTVGSRDAGYLFEFKPGAGVFLTVYPANEGEVKFELSDMRQILQDYSVLDYDIAHLSRIVREASGRSYKLSDVFVEPKNKRKYGREADDDDQDAPMPPGEDERYANIIVDISRDRMVARVRYDTKAGSRLPTPEMVLDAMQAKKVAYGIKMQNIEEGVKSLSPFVVAEGDPPVHGENARIERRFELGVKGRPVVVEYDRVDYKNLNLFVLAKKNDVLAVRIPQTKGTPGKNIYGDRVPARDGRPVPLPQGKNTQIIGENELVATIDGQIVDTGRIISVDPHLVLNGGVGVATGNINFTGSVEVKGDIAAGFKVKATGDINVSGVINGAMVEGRNIYVSGGVNGMDRAKIVAEEDIRAAFCEMADLQANRDIYISDVALHSQLRAGRKIIMEGKKGQIMGGRAMAGEEVQAQYIGNASNIITRVSVGVDPNTQRKYKEACVRFKETKQRLEQITKTLNTLGKIDISRLPENRIAQINELTRSQFPLAGQMRRDEKLIAQLNEELAVMRNGRIKVNDTIYAGARVIINSVAKNFYSDAKHCTVSVVDDVVTIGPY